MSQADGLVNWTVYRQAQNALGGGFIRILGYFREDGIASVAAIEEAMRAHKATAMVLPAHTLKGEAGQFGAEPLSALAAEIEDIARNCVELHDTPEEALAQVVALRPLFEQTLGALERECNPLLTRRAGFGQRAA